MIIEYLLGDYPGVVFFIPLYVTHFVSLILIHLFHLAIVLYVSLPLVHLHPIYRLLSVWLIKIAQTANV